MTTRQHELEEEQEAMQPSECCCAVCHVECDHEDDWCYGCNNIICTECANRQTAKWTVGTNEHTLEDHRP